MTRESNPEFEAFTRTIDHLLTVSHDELKRRMEEYKVQAAKNPHKRGPKPKVKRKHKSH
jgi:iron-sulfur cluster repair protein YtfE (RIC family)